MDIHEFRTAERQHGGGRVQLHRARSQRDHGLSQGNILSSQTGDVTHQLGLRMIFLEYVLLQEIGGTGEFSVEISLGGDRLVQHIVFTCGAGEDV